MKISNKVKDLIIIWLIIFVVMFSIFGFGFAIVKCFAENNKIVSEYQSRETIIRAETEEDRFYNDMWRSQYREHYGIDYEEMEVM